MGVEPSVVDYLSQVPSAAPWARVGVRPHHGINVPLFSLRSAQSAGIGEYLDLLPLIDWCEEVGLDVIQLLPLNDSGTETSPFSALSAFALDPKYLSLHSLSNATEYANLSVLLDSLRALNGSQHIQYEKIYHLKQMFMRQYLAQEGQALLSTPGYVQFVEQNEWLGGYSLFKALKSRYLGDSWENWPAEEREPTPTVVAELSQRYQSEVMYHQMIQYLCFQQMRQVREHAEVKNVWLKGDIPILINRESADVWLHRGLFSMDLTAGAPPDMYSVEGQKWGFPIYYWPAHEEDDYRWWRARLRYVSHFYHIYRVDHIVGFFRIFAIPVDKPPSEGHFEPDDKHSWTAQGKKILEMMIGESPLLPIGEDLGVIPPSVRTTMHQLGIPGTKVLRWERLWEEEDPAFILPLEFDPISLTTVSTHDSQVFRDWWQAYPAEAAEYAESRGWSYGPQWTPELQKMMMQDAHRGTSLFHIDLLQEYLGLFPELIWPTADEERINVPGTVDRRNWRYRFRPPIEEIAHHKGLKKEIIDLVSK